MLKDCEFNDRTMIIVSLAFCVGVGPYTNRCELVVSLLLSLILPKNKSEKVEE